MGSSVFNRYLYGRNGPILCRLDLYHFSPTNIDETWCYSCYRFLLCFLMNLARNIIRLPQYET